MPSQGTSTFDLFALRYHCEAPEPVHFPPGETANLFRGQFGKILYRRDPALYTRFFAPVHEAGVPSGLHDPPRPFALRVRHLDGATLQEFHVGLNVFETNQPDLVQILLVMGDLVQESLRAECRDFEDPDLLRLPLVGSPSAERVRVTFLSPTELKNQERPEFGPMFSRIRDRINLLELDSLAKMGRPGLVTGTRELIEYPYIIVYEVDSDRQEVSVLIDCARSR